MTAKLCLFRSRATCESAGQHSVPGPTAYNSMVGREVHLAVLAYAATDKSLSRLGRVLGGRTKHSAAERVAGARRRLGS